MLQLSCSSRHPTEFTCRSKKKENTPPTAALLLSELGPFLNVWLRVLALSILPVTSWSQATLVDVTLHKQNIKRNESRWGKVASPYGYSWGMTPNLILPLPTYQHEVSRISFGSIAQSSKLNWTSIHFHISPMGVEPIFSSWKNDDLTDSRRGHESRNNFHHFLMF